MTRLRFRISCGLYAARLLLGARRQSRQTGKPMIEILETHLAQQQAVLELIRRIEHEHALEEIRQQAAQQAWLN